MVWGLRESDNGLVLVPRGDKNQLVFEGLPPAFSNIKTMKLEPSNFPGKAVFTTKTQQHGHGMDQFVTFGDANDANAMTVFVDGDFIHNANKFYSVLDAWDHKNRKEGTVFFTKEKDDSGQIFTINSNGTISLDKDPQYVLGTNDKQNIVKWVLDDDKNRFIFENA